MITASDIKLARWCGESAYVQGVNAPMLDKPFLSLVEDATDGSMGSSLPLLKAWQEGYQRGKATRKRGENV